jgi:hypothetical protein
MDTFSSCASSPATLIDPSAYIFKAKHHESSQVFLPCASSPGTFDGHCSLGFQCETSLFHPTPTKNYFCLFLCFNSKSAEHRFIACSSISIAHNGLWYVNGSCNKSFLVKSFGRSAPSTGLIHEKMCSSVASSE